MNHITLLTFYSPMPRPLLPQLLLAHIHNYVVLVSGTVINVPETVITSINLPSLFNCCSGFGWFGQVELSDT